MRLNYSDEGYERKIQRLYAALEEEATSEHDVQGNANGHTLLINLQVTMTPMRFNRSDNDMKEGSSGSSSSDSSTESSASSNSDLRLLSDDDRVGNEVASFTGGFCSLGCGLLGSWLRM